MAKFTQGQRIAVDNYLNEYPDGACYEDITTVLYESEGWSLPTGYCLPEFFEDFHPPLIGEYIETLSKDIDDAINAPLDKILAIATSDSADKMDELTQVALNGRPAEDVEQLIKEVLSNAKP